MQHKLHVIIGSTRPGRICPMVAKWFFELAQGNNGFDASLVDLADFALPVFDEPEHPRSGKYMHEHTRSWADSVAAADCFVFVTPEYNSCTTPALTNALTYLFHEWSYKAAGVISYGGISGGLRAAQHLKQSLTAMKIVAPPEGVAIPNVFGHLKDGRFVSNEAIDGSASAMLNELKRWTSALETMRKV